jgi:[acyl-carrier-protein] S-malonyltransferase
MCRQLWSFPAAREVLDRLSSTLGDDLEYLTTRAATPELSLTANAQRAIHAHHLGHWFAFRAAHPEIRLDGAIGHSVGIVAALVAADSLSIEDSGTFVAGRARAFSDICAGLDGLYGLAAVSTEDLGDLVAELPRFPSLTLALRHSTGKGTVGGRLADIEELSRVARREAWPLRVTLLEVEGPYHTDVFQPTGRRLERVLATLSVRPPQVPVFMGTSGRAETDPDRIRTLLAKQPFTPEAHLDAVRSAYAHGCRRFLEVAHSPQPIHWIAEQLVDEKGAPSRDVTARGVTTDEIETNGKL